MSDEAAGAAALRVFRGVCQVAQRATIEPGRCRGESFASVPEITLIPVKLTLCKISSLTLSPGFSLIPFSSDELQTKEKCLRWFWFHLFFFFFIVLGNISGAADLWPISTELQAKPGKRRNLRLLQRLYSEDTNISARFIEVWGKSLCLGLGFYFLFFFHFAARQEDWMGKWKCMMVLYGLQYWVFFLNLFSIVEAANIHYFVIDKFWRNFSVNPYMLQSRSRQHFYSTQRKQLQSRLRRN